MPRSRWSNLAILGDSSCQQNIVLDAITGLKDVCFEFRIISPKGNVLREVPVFPHPPLDKIDMVIGRGQMLTFLDSVDIC